MINLVPRELDAFKGRTVELAINSDYRTVTDVRPMGELLACEPVYGGQWELIVRNIDDGFSHAYLLDADAVVCVEGDALEARYPESFVPYADSHWRQGWSNE